MRKLYTFLIITFLFNTALKAQWSFLQHFDGADTAASNSIIIDLGSDTNNIWQIGSPQKTLFHSALTVPNAIVTDTINYYPPSDTSSFTFQITSSLFGWGIFAIQWVQKINYDHDFDGGMIEYTTDDGVTWENVFNNPYVYNFYGFDPSSPDTLGGTNYAFSGTDTTWRNIWLCFDNSFLMSFDTIYFKFTSISDSMNTNKEGWLIDNMMAHITIVHTVKQEKASEYLNVYPSPTSGIVNIDIEKQQGYHIIEHMELMDAAGRIVRKYGISPTKFYIDLGDLPDGNYFLRVKTNLKEVTVPVILNKNR